MVLVLVLEMVLVQVLVPPVLPPPPVLPLLPVLWGVRPTRGAMLHACRIKGLKNKE